MTTTATKRAAPVRSESPLKQQGKFRSRSSSLEQAYARLLMEECQLPKTDTPDSVREIIELFLRDATWLEQAGQQLREFPIKAIELNAHAADHAEREALKNHVRAHVAARTRNTTRSIRAQLDPLVAGELDTDVSQLRAYAIRCLAETAQAEAAMAVELLEELVKEGFIGRYVRSGSFLRYSFVETCLVYVRGRVSRRDHVRLATNAPGTRRAICRVAHEHSIIDARFEPVDRTTTVPPPSAKQLLSCLPPWLAPLVNVIQGDIYQVNEKEELLDYDSFRDLATVEEERLQLILDDPAVVIGGNTGVGYVLTGWFEDPAKETRTPSAPTTLFRQVALIVMSLVFFALSLFLMNPGWVIGLLGAFLTVAMLSVATCRANQRYGKPPVFIYRL